MQRCGQRPTKNAHNEHYRNSLCSYLTRGKTLFAWHVSLGNDVFFNMIGKSNSWRLQALTEVSWNQFTGDIMLKKPKGEKYEQKKPRLLEIVWYSLWSCSGCRAQSSFGLCGLLLVLLLLMLSCMLLSPESNETQS